MEHALAQASDAITEGRDAVHALRSGGSTTVDLGEAINKFGKNLLGGATTETVLSLAFRLKEHRGPSIP